MPFDIEKMRQLAQPVSEKSRREAEYRHENRDWLRKSAQIAFAVRRELRKQGLSQQVLAQRMNVSPQYVGKLLKGKDNLTLETISKMEKALGCTLIRVQGMPDSQENAARQTAMYVFSTVFGREMDPVRISVNHSRKQAVPQLS
jgi:transcriptional regulator with XRE-family HTH domain